MSQTLTREMMVLAFKDNHHAAVSLHPGRTIEVLGPAPDDRFVRIQVDGEEFEAFATDVEERCGSLKLRGDAQRTSAA